MVSLLRKTVEVRALLLFVISTSMGLTVSYYIYREIIAMRAAPRAPVSDSGYSLMLVDHRGAPLVDRPGDLKLVMDPFTLYRNFPCQKTSRFTIDARGYRESRLKYPSRPTVVILGASLTFGFGLQSDADTFVSQLNARNAEYAFVNAGIVAYLSGQELSEMVHYADRLAPAIYIVVDGWNEQYCQLFPNLQSTEFGYNWQSLTNLETLFRSQIPGHAASALEADCASRAGQLLEGSRLQDKIIETYSANLKKMADFAHSRGAQFLVAFQPQLGNKKKRAASEETAWAEWQAAYSKTHADFVNLYNSMIARAREFCASQGIPFLDLNASALFWNHPGELFLDTVHLNAEGHSLVAWLLDEYLRQGRAGALAGRAKEMQQ